MAKDLLENLGIVTMLSVYPSTPDALAWVTALATLIKWLFAAATIALDIGGAGKTAMNGFKKQT